jgi:E3 ubiquitin-protein ligase UBR7
MRDESVFLLCHGSCHTCPSRIVDVTVDSYNQNFKGVYCQCARPYPDPEDSLDDIMLQCSICEDWYHGRHLGREDSLPDQDSFEEMTCEVCTDRCSFLRTYARISLG